MLTKAQMCVKVWLCCRALMSPRTASISTSCGPTHSSPSASTFSNWLASSARDRLPSAAVLVSRLQRQSTETSQGSLAAMMATVSPVWCWPVQRTSAMVETSSLPVVANGLSSICNIAVVSQWCKQIRGPLYTIDAQVPLTMETDLELFSPTTPCNRVAYHVVQPTPASGFHFQSVEWETRCHHGPLGSAPSTECSGGLCQLGCMWKFPNSTIH